MQLEAQLVVFPFAYLPWLWAWWIILLQYRAVANRPDLLQQPLPVAVFFFFSHSQSWEVLPHQPSNISYCKITPRSWNVTKKKGTHTQGEDVGATGSGHMVLLDGLVERGLAQQQEAEANPHGQQPGHGKAESAGQHTAGGGAREAQGQLYYSMSTHT